MEKVKKSFQKGTQLKKIISFVTLLTLASSSFAVAVPEASAGAVCPQGDVKYEIGGGYEYTDDSATISGDETTISWSAAEGCTITNVCIKIGGPGGGELVSPDPSSGQWTTETYGISHVVINTDCEEPGPVCGNGIVETGESCDDGENNGEYGYCNQDCTAMGPYCGDGNIDDPDEACEADVDCSCGELCTECQCVSEPGQETDVTLCKEDNEGTKLGGWELSLVSDTFSATGTTEGQCQNTGCVTFEDVPYGTYEIEEVLKEGWENVSGLGEVEINSENPTFTIVNKETEEPETVTIKSYKVVCETETDLPNWGSGGSDITETTASDYVTESQGKCWLEADWNFEWGFDGEAQKQSGDYYGFAPEGTGWHDFDSATGDGTSAQVQITDLEGNTKLWLREVLKEGYVPFSYPPDPSPGSNVSAEFYCHSDVLNYDNYEWIQGVELGNTYYCVAFNAPVEEPQPECGNGILEGDEECDDGNTEDDDGCSANCEIELVCDPNVELVTNGGFETPEVTHSKKWDIFADIIGWTIGWNTSESTYSGLDRPLDAYLELHRGVNGWLPQGGNQYAELDSDWDGPDGSVSGEPASVQIYQDIETIPGENYSVSFWFSPRPSTTEPNNQLEFSWAGTAQPVISGAGDSQTSWAEHAYNFTATGDTTRIQFANLGTSDSLGTFLDNVSVRCQPMQEPVCGNGTLEEGEECDDGNTEDDDGCSASCMIEVTPELLTIKSYKVVCETEADLPNWGSGGSDITGTTAQDFVNGNQNCHLEEDWSFEWAYAGTANPGDNIIGPAGGAWTTFGPTESNGLAVTSIGSLSGDRIWVREVMQEGYIPFSGDTSVPRDNVSAEMYCHKDVLNYDNYDYIINPVLGETYYCVAFNAPEGGVTTYSLTASTTGFGWVTSSPEGINCGYEAFDCQKDYEEGTDVTLTATPGGGQKFDGWGGDCSGTTTVCVLTMDAPKSVTAAFSLIPGVITYTVTFDGNGGIPTSTDVVVMEGETVDPLPTATRTGYDFIEWNTASDGSGDEFTTATAVTADITVYAIWQEVEEPIEGCTDPDATNYNASATVDDGSCTYPPGPVYGCTDPSATNYNASATADDGSCTYARRSGGFAPGRVLGQQIAEECGLYLYEYIEYGASNNPYEVRKLQTFLNLHTGSSLPITGIYDWATMQVLNQFQVQYKEEVLQPWVDAGTHCDVNEPTGYVYKTTQRWINLIMCPTLNLPMPNLSGYPQTDCTAYWQAVLGTDIIVPEDGVSDGTTEGNGATEENGAAEAEGLEDLIPEDEEILQIETEGEAETKEREIPMFWLIAIIILAAVALIWFVYKGMKR